MKIKCIFDSQDFAVRNNAVVEVRSSIDPREVKIVILDRTTLKEENSFAIEGEELIRAVENAMNWDVGRQFTISSLNSH